MADPVLQRDCVNEFCTNLGHGGNHAGLELENTPVLEHYLLGIQWALGDLRNVDATPVGAVKKP